MMLSYVKRLLSSSSHHHHMEKTEAGLKGLCIREIMTKYTLYYTKYYTIITLSNIISVTTNHCLYLKIT